MRSRAVVAIVLLLIPVAVSAQRMPRLPGRRPTQPQPLPPQPGVIARDLAYKRLRIAFESYPLFSYLQSPGIAGNRAPTNRASIGAGTRADYRLTRFISATMDVTELSLLGSTHTETVELGTRLRPERTERKVYPFVDFRVGFVHSSDRYFRPFDVIDGSAGFAGSGGRFSRGFGGVAGAGVEYALTRRFSLTTAASVLESRMTTYDIRGQAPAGGRYSLTAYRFTLGLRYNPVRVITPTTETP